KLGPLIVDPAPALFDNLADRPALRVAPGDQPLRLRVEILFVLTRRHPCVYSDDVLFGWLSWYVFDSLLNNDRASRQLIPSDVASSKQSVGCVVMDSEFFGIARQLHTFSIVYAVVFCKR